MFICEIFFLLQFIQFKVREEKTCCHIKSLYFWSCDHRCEYTSVAKSVNQCQLLIRHNMHRNVRVGNYVSLAKSVGRGMVAYSNRKRLFEQNEQK